MKGEVSIRTKVGYVISGILFLIVLALVLEIPTLLRFLLIGFSIGLFGLVGSVYYFYKKTIGTKPQKGAQYGR